MAMFFITPRVSQNVSRINFTSLSSINSVTSDSEKNIKSLLLAFSFVWNNGKFSTILHKATWYCHRVRCRNTAPQPATGSTYFFIIPQFLRFVNKKTNLFCKFSLILPILSYFYKISRWDSFFLKERPPTFSARSSMDFAFPDRTTPLLRQIFFAVPATIKLFSTGRRKEYHHACYHPTGKPLPDSSTRRRN